MIIWKIINLDKGGFMSEVEKNCFLKRIGIGCIHE